MSELDGIISEFLVESYENLDQLDRDLVTLEKDPRNPQRLASIFRTIHTIKGTCGFLGFSKLESVTHVGENLLSRLRDGLLFLNPEITSALLALMDAVREMLTRIESTGQEGDGNYAQLIATLTRLQEAPQILLAEVEENLSLRDQALAEQVQISEMADESTVVNPSGLLQADEGLPCNQQQADLTPHAEPNSESVTSFSQSPKATQDTTSTGVCESSIRVDVRLLDKLMNLVGELVLARNQILQFTSSQKDTAFISTSQRLNLITTELQESVMKTRMQPIGNIWNRFPRVVRDLATSCRKQVRIEMEGKETELDKTIIEAIKDPLTHIVRNSVDHGIEPPEVRLAKGKPAEGCLYMRAYHEGGQVNIEITDDGAGINAENVKRKALERGLITRDQAERLSDRDCMHLIFLPGFSTAESVTNVSGRGVGMDVVKTNIERIGGTVDIQCQPGKGTTLKIKIPLTLAIIPALIVTCGGDRYAIPQVSLLELVRLEGDQVRQEIELIHGVPVYRLRGNLLPLVYLNKELQVENHRHECVVDALNIVVLQADDRQFGLIVEGICDTEEIVVKPLGKLLKGIMVFAGATIMGDGRVALILDVLGIAQHAGVVSEVRDRSLSELAAKIQDRQNTIHTLLLAGLGLTGRIAIPLSFVARLEEIPTSCVEVADGQEVVQFRGQIMPLIRLSQLLQCNDAIADQDKLQVVVYTANGRSFGLVADHIIDIVETTLDLKPSTRQHGILGSAIIQQRVTDLLDIQGIIRTFDPGFFDTCDVAAPNHV